jgi:hypothetical protein
MRGGRSTLSVGKPALELSSKRTSEDTSRKSPPNKPCKALNALIKARPARSFQIML